MANRLLITNRQLFLRQFREKIGNSLCRLLDGRMEALEFAVRENAPFVGKTLQQLTFRAGVLIVGIVREGKLIHPQGSDSMQPGDLVTVVTTIPGIQTLEQTLAEGKA